MNNDVNAKLVEAATAAGWEAGDVDAAPSAGLDANGCRFFSALHRRRMDAPALELALLPGGEVVAGGRDDAAARILSGCGAGQDAGWWAEVVTRFSASAPGRVVQSGNAADIERIEAAGARFAAPALEQAPAGTTLRFFSVQYEPARAARVSATLSPDGALSVAAEPVDL